MNLLQTVLMFLLRFWPHRTTRVKPVANGEEGRISDPAGERVVFVWLPFLGWRTLQWHPRRWAGSDLRKYAVRLSASRPAQLRPAFSQNETSRLDKPKTIHGSSDSHA